MNGILEITLNGQRERLRFNNYARNELRRFFVPEDKPYLSEGELMKAIIDKWKENEHLLLKMLVYAGIVGDSLVSGYKSRLTEEEIGEYIGGANPEELLVIWKAFIDAQGFNLTPTEQGEEEEETDEKKKDEDNLAFAFGELGLTPHEYYSMTPKEVILMTRGYLMKRSKEWEQTRIIAYTVETTKKIKGKHPPLRKFMPLPSDKKGSTDDSTIRRMLDTLKRVKEKQQ